MQEQRKTGLIILSPIILVGAGFVWGYVWFSAFHAILGFAFISPVVDILVYRYVGAQLHHKLSASNLNRGVQILLGAFDIAMFYIGNRVLLFGWFLNLWPYQGNEIFWLLVSWDILSMITGLSTATGLAEWIKRFARDHRVWA